MLWRCFIHAPSNLHDTFGDIKHKTPLWMLFFTVGENLIKPKRERSINSGANILILNDTAGATTQT